MFRLKFFFFNCLNFFFNIFFFFYLHILSWSRKYYVFSHLEVYLELREFELFFKESGYWDYFILSIYDLYFCYYGIYSLFIISDFFIIEHASWIMHIIYTYYLKYFIFFELKALNEFFFFFLVCIIILSAYFLYFYILFF